MNPRMWVRAARSMDGHQSGDPIWSLRVKLLRAFGTAKMVFDRSSEELSHCTIARDIRMQAIRSAPQTIRIRGIRYGRVSVAEQDPEDLRQVLDPRVEREDVPRRARGRGIVRKDRGRDRDNPRVEDVRVHGGQVTFDCLGPLARKDVAHSSKDDRIGGTRPEYIPRKTGSNLPRGLASAP